MKKVILIIILFLVAGGYLFLRLTMPELFYENIPPVLKNLGVDFAPYNPTTGKAGAFIFDNQMDKVFLEFGARIEGRYGPKILPTFEYYLDPDADVYALSDGIVREIGFKEETQDYYVRISPAPNSYWLVEYDHVTSLQVSEGQEVSAGQIIGKPGNWKSDIGRTEIMILEIRGTKDIAYAPFKLFDPQLRSEYEQKVWQLMADWEKFKGDPTIYDENSMVCAGCLYERLLSLEEGAEVIE